MLGPWLLGKRGPGAFVGSAGEGDGGFEEPPTVIDINGDVTIHGKVKPGSFGKFVYPLATIAAGRQYTFRAVANFSQLAKQGKLAMVGFGLKNGNDFHLCGLRGDGSTGTNEYIVHGTPPNGWNKQTGHTEIDNGAAGAGTQHSAYYRLITSSDGATYTLKTSADGSSYTTVETGRTPSPFSNVSGVTTFGVALWFNNTDAGPFTIQITQFADVAGLFAPTDLGAGLLLWLKGDTLTGNDGDNIAAWNDSSGNGRNFTQATEADKPNLEVAELNGMNVVHFTGSNTEFLTGASLGGVATSASLFYVVKAATNDSGSGGPGHFGSGGSSNQYTFGDGHLYNGDLSTVRKDAGNPTPSVAAWNILSIASAANDWKCRIGGTQLFTTATNTVGFSTTPALGQSLTQHFTGDIAEVVLMDGINTTNRDKVEGYLAHKWGITSILDAAHPYKSSPP